MRERILAARSEVVGLDNIVVRLVGIYYQDPVAGLSEPEHILSVSVVTIERQTGRETTHLNVQALRTGCAIRTDSRIQYRRLPVGRRVVFDGVLVKRAAEVSRFSPYVLCTSKPACQTYSSGPGAKTCNTVDQS